MSRKFLLFIILLLVALGSAGFIWFRYFYAPSPVSIDESGVISGELADRLVKFRSIQKMQLDTSLLEDKFFQDLSLPISVATFSTPTSTSTDRNVATYGRSNPFEPF